MNSSFYSLIRYTIYNITANILSDAQGTKH